MITVSWEEIRAMNKAQVHNLEEILEFHEKYLRENEDGDYNELRKEEER